MRKFFKRLTIVCAILWLFFGSCLNSTEHFWEFFVATVVCMIECFAYLYWLQNGDY